jgi:flagellar motor switch protein FliG
MADAAATETELTGIQRAAILVMYMGRDVGRRILERMTDDEVRAIGLAMAEIDQVAPDTIENSVGEFIRELHLVAMMPRSGADFVTAVLPELLDEQRRAELLPMINRRVNRDFEAFIAARPPSAVSAILQDEHPQTQAVALALMGPQNAAKVVRFLPAEVKSEVTMRMARLKRIPGELADDVLQALRVALGRQDDHLEVGGVDKTARMLGKMSRAENDRILDLVSDEDSDLADALRRRMFLFEDLSLLNNRAIQAVLKEVERDDLLMSLKGSSPELVELFLGNVSKRAAEDMREEIEIMGPQPRRRVRAAQERIVAAALKLADEGTIYLPMGGDDDEDGE